eukprot:TRINITY_DN2099_c0_g1_i1.p1 TRINITY_DN2099_c0_g1~~TRINITY_DN2099_c0_g1_i1.p1  ORF type:complete len:934 (-),score=252.92 TRINITY_DN2099_c0_g1_i1:24-2825(-)
MASQNSGGGSSPAASIWGKGLMKFRAFQGLYKTPSDHERVKRSTDDMEFYRQEVRPNDYLSDEEIMEKLSSEFYTEKMNTTLFMLEKLPAELTEAWFDRELFEKERALDQITSKLSQKVMSNYNAFVEAMSHINDLATDLQISASVCKSGRHNLNTTKEHLILRVLTILVKYRKRQRYKEIIESLVNIKRIKLLDGMLKQALEEGDFPKAIQLCVDCGAEFDANKQFTCVKELAASMKDCYSLVQDKVDGALAETCSSFNAVNYERILVAYRFLDQSYRALDKLQRCFLDAITNSTRNILTAHILMGRGTQNIENLKTMKFSDLCAAVKDENLRNCLISILDVLCDVMLNHYLMSEWHEQYEKTTADDDNRKFLNDIKDALAKFKKTLWDDIQRKVSAVLSTNRITKFKIDDFLEVLEAVHQFIDIGEEFSDSDAHSLRRSIRQQSKVYFDNLHRMKIEDLYTMIENEMWQKVPVQKDFSIMHIKEFKTFTTAGADMGFSSVQKEAKKGTLLATYKEFGNPFRSMLDPIKPDATAHRETDKSEPDPEDEVVPDELNVERVEEYKGEVTTPKNKAAGPSEGYLLTTTTINVIRFITKYLQMMKILQPIAFEIFIGITQLFEYYMFGVYYLFARGDEENANIPPRLRLSLAKMYRTFFPNPETQQAQDATGIRMRMPKLQLNLNDPNTAFGLYNRMIAIESLDFLESAMQAIKPHLQSLLPKANEKNVTDFYVQDVDIIKELVKFSKKNVIQRFLLWDEIMNSIANLRWDTGSSKVESSPYVTRLINDFSVLQRDKRVTSVMRNFPQKVQNNFWDLTITYAMESLVEGYSRVKKCSVEGRAQMQLDLKYLQQGLEKVTATRPIPGGQYVENYIKAYFQTEMDILPWCKDHKEYALRHWLSIVNQGVGVNMKKPAKQELIAQLENPDKQRKRQVIV